MRLRINQTGLVTAAMMAAGCCITFIVPVAAAEEPVLIKLTDGQNEMLTTAGIGATFHAGPAGGGGAAR